MLGWTLREVLEHTPAQLEAMSEAIEASARRKRIAAAHKRSARM